MVWEEREREGKTAGRENRYRFHITSATGKTFHFEDLQNIYSATPIGLTYFKITFYNHVYIVVLLLQREVINNSLFFVIVWKRSLV